MLQNGNNVNVISLDPTGLITPSDEVFDTFIYDKEFSISRVVSRTQFKANADCELMSVYMTSYLIRLIILNPNVSIFNEVEDKIQTGSQYDTNDNCSQAKLLTLMLLLFSEKFTDYSSQIKKDDFDGLANKKVVTADDRINFLQGPVLERLGAIDRDINPTLYISIDKTIQEEAIDFLNNTIAFINKNKNLYQPIDQLNGNNETRKQFEERKKEYSKQANRLKFGYANKLYIKYKAKKLHENTIKFHDLSNSNVISNTKESVEQLPKETARIFEL